MLIVYILSHCNIIEAPSRSSPSFTLKPKNFTQIQHSTVTFECRAVGAPAPTINWVKYTDSGETLISSNARFVIGAVSRYLSILGIYWSDAGRYGCVAQNKHGRIVADAYLTVISGELHYFNLPDFFFLCILKKNIYISYLKPSCPGQL